MKSASLTTTMKDAPPTSKRTLQLCGLQPFPDEAQYEDDIQNDKYDTGNGHAHHDQQGHILQLGLQCGADLTGFWRRVA